MGERALVRVFACAVELPEFANFCLKFHFEALFSDWRFLLSRIRHGISWCFICLRTTIWLRCLYGYVRSFLLCLLTSCISILGRLVGFDGHILKELFGCGRFEMIAKAVIFPGLSLSLIFKILLLDRCFITMSFVLSVLCVLTKISHFRLYALSHGHWHGDTGSLLIWVSIWLSHRWGTAIKEGCPRGILTVRMMIISCSLLRICLILIVRYIRR